MFFLFRKHKSKSINNKLLQAVMEDNLKGVQKALDQRADVSLHSGKLREPLLLTAVKHASLPIIETLVKAGADINDFDANCTTPLLYACTEKKLEIISFLLDNNAKPNMTDKSGCTALAIFFNYLPARINAVNHLYSHGKNFLSDDELIIEAKIAQKLFEKGAIIKQLKMHDNNPLLIAIQAVNKNLVEVILKQKTFDVNATDQWNFTPLMAACEIKSPQIARPIIDVILKNGADINAAAKHWGTALGYSVEKGNIAVAQHLLDAGANPNVCNQSAQTPLMVAVQKGNRDMVHKLLKAGVDVNLQDKNGDTALLIALNSENYTPEMFQIINLLIQNNSNSQIQNNYHETAWNVLLKEANPRILLFIQNVITQIQNKQSTPEEMLEKLNIGMEKLIKTNTNNFKKCVWPNHKNSKNMLLLNQQHIKQ